MRSGQSGGIGTVQDFRRTAAEFASGVTIVSTVTDGEPHATTVNSFTSVSAEPPLILVCLGKTGRLAPRIIRAGRFAVTVLSRAQEDLARRFASAGRPSGRREFGAGWFPAPESGAPVHGDGVAYFDCVLHEKVSAGDHDIFVGEPVAYSALADAPQLIFSRSAFTQLNRGTAAGRSA